MKPSDLIAMSKRNPVETIGQMQARSITETIGSLTIWAAGLFGTIWLAKWYTVKSLKEMGLFNKDATK